MSAQRGWGRRKLEVLARSLAGSASATRFPPSRLTSDHAPLGPKLLRLAQATDSSLSSTRPTQPEVACSSSACSLASLSRHRSRLAHGVAGRAADLSNSRDVIESAQARSDAPRRTMLAPFVSCPDSAVCSPVRPLGRTASLTLWLLRFAHASRASPASQLALPCRALKLRRLPRRRLLRQLALLRASAPLSSTSTTSASSFRSTSATRAVRAAFSLCPRAPRAPRAGLTLFRRASTASVTLAHLSWGSRPLSPTSSTLRTVLTYPYSSPTVTPVPSRTPSLAAYDRHDRPRAFGAECLTASATALARDEGWIIVKGWKAQMKPPPQDVVAARSPAHGPPAAEVGKKLLKKIRAPLSSSSSHSTTSISPAHLGPPPSPAPGAASWAPSSARTSLRSLASSEGLVDAAGSPRAPSPSTPSTDASYVLVSAGMGGIDGGTGALCDLGRSSVGAPPPKPKDKGKPADARKVHHGPRLRSIYAEYLKWLVACARAWYGETPGGDDTFVRCWDEARFVFAIPADWTTDETDLVRGAIEDARLLPANFEVGRLVRPLSLALFFLARSLPRPTRLAQVTDAPRHADVRQGAGRHHLFRRSSHALDHLARGGLVLRTRRRSRAGRLDRSSLFHTILLQSQN